MLRKEIDFVVLCVGDTVEDGVLAFRDAHFSGNNLFIPQDPCSLRCSPKLKDSSKRSVWKATLILFLIRELNSYFLLSDKIPVLREGKLPVVGIGKHLCGVATDLALQCLLETYAASYGERNEEPLAKRIKNDKTEKEMNTLAKEGNERSVPEKQTPVAGIVIALCCHHRCDWRHYVGKEYFRALGLGAVEFYYFQRMSSWAT
ncbi:tRNA:m(4)X modification enzyme TRM13 homolog, partial [Nannospalax galili]|uniref:tRNA:m(4)X modification enzyme TRM13 homolog n=1 Tax=Nannospalax galili TaxID=1026970 RepID=UPI000819BD11